jgi:hypothetical protein
LRFRGRREIRHRRSVPRRRRVDDAFVEAFRQKAAEHDRMDRADARACLHRAYGFDRHRHVDNDTIAFFNAQRFEPIRELADAAVQLAVADGGDFAVVGLENQRGFVGLGLKMAVETVEGSVELAIVEPAVERRIAAVEYEGEGFVPEHMLAGKARPERGGVAFGLGAHRVIGFHAGDIGLFDEIGTRREQPVFM